MISIFVFWAQA